MRLGRNSGRRWDGVVFDEELRSVSVAEAFQDEDLLKKFDKNFNATARITARLVRTGRLMIMKRDRIVEFPVHRGDVVPGFV